MDSNQTAAKRLDNLIRQVQDLPSLPIAVTRVMQLTNDPKAGLSDVAHALASDQGLAARVLKLANSAYYGSSRRIGTVSEAVVILGMRTTRNLTLATSCQDMLEREVQGYFLPRGALWRHSLACAAAAQNLARRAHFRGTEEAFVAGLLHDIGKVVMSAYLKAEFAQVLTRVAKGRLTFSDAEREVLGFDDAEVGARLLERWNLPSTLSQRYGIIMPHRKPRRVRWPHWCMSPIRSASLWGSVSASTAWPIRWTQMLWRCSILQRTISSRSPARPVTRFPKPGRSFK